MAGLSGPFDALLAVIVRAAAHAAFPLSIAFHYRGNSAEKINTAELRGVFLHNMIVFAALDSCGDAGQTTAARSYALIAAVSTFASHVYDDFHVQTSLRLRILRRSFLFIGLGVRRRNAPQEETS